MPSRHEPRTPGTSTLRSGEHALWLTVLKSLPARRAREGCPIPGDPGMPSTWAHPVCWLCECPRSLMGACQSDE